MDAGTSVDDENKGKPASEEEIEPNGNEDEFNPFADDDHDQNDDSDVDNNNVDKEDSSSK